MGASRQLKLEPPSGLLPTEARSRPCKAQWALSLQWMLVGGMQVGKPGEEP